MKSFRNPQLESQTEIMPMKLNLSKFEPHDGIMAADIEESRETGKGLSKDGGEGRAGHTPMEHHHKQKIQHDIDHTGDE